MSIESLKAMLDVDPALWEAEAEGVAEFYAKFEGKVPAELKASLEALKAKL